MSELNDKANDNTEAEGTQKNVTETGKQGDTQKNITETEKQGDKKQNETGGAEGAVKPKEPDKQVQRNEKQTAFNETEWKEFSSKFVPEKFNSGAGEIELISSDAVNSFLPVAKELGLNTEQGSKLISFLSEFNKNVLIKRDEERNTRIDKYEADLRANNEFSGDGKFDENIKTAQQGMKALFNGNKEVLKFLNDSGLGSHPDVVIGCWKIGLMEKEGKTLGKSVVDKKGDGLEGFFQKTLETGA